MADAVEKVQTTSDFYRTTNLPERFNNPELQKGYGDRSKHPIYCTSSSVYGGTKPSVHTMPTQFHGKGTKFTSHLAASGNYRDNGLNTSLDKTYVSK